MVNVSSHSADAASCRPPFITHSFFSVPTVKLCWLGAAPAPSASMIVGKAAEPVRPTFLGGVVEAKIWGEG